MSSLTFLHQLWKDSCASTKWMIVSCIIYVILGLIWVALSPESFRLIGWLMQPFLIAALLIGLVVTRK